VREIFVVLFASCLTACATTPADPRIVVKEVPTAVPVACKPNLPPAPIYPDTAEALAASTDIFTGVQLLIAGRLLRIAREGQLKAAVAGCAG
jgi:hypothetical protein